MKEEEEALPLRTRLRRRLVRWGRRHQGHRRGTPGRRHRGGSCRSRELLRRRGRRRLAGLGTAAGGGRRPLALGISDGGSVTGLTYDSEGIAPTH